MKKTISLIRACMTSDMNLFKIRQKNDNLRSKYLLPVVLCFVLMFMMWSNANVIFEKLAPLHLQMLVLSMGVFAVSFLTFMEGIYKTGSLLFNCRDDQLLLSLPIPRSKVLFVRIFKFYVFELMFNTVFFVPILVAYLRWADSISISFFVISLVMLLFLPIIPIVFSCMVGAITTSISSRFKFKNLAQIIISMLLVLLIFYASYNMDSLLTKLAEHATSINDFITKIYYPAGIYVTFLADFSWKDFLIYIGINIGLFLFTIFLLSKVYFKINSRLKVVSSSKKVKVENLTIRSHSKMHSLILKELNTFFHTPVFVVNAGFGLFLFLLASIILSIKFDSFLPFIIDPNGLDIPKEFLESHLSIMILALVSGGSFMTSITNSVISLEGRNITILKSLPISVKQILLSKVFAASVITTPLLVVGDLILLIRFQIPIVEGILILFLSLFMPLFSHLTGVLINLKYPKLDFENSAEAVKQSTSSFLSVMINMSLFIFTFILLGYCIEFCSSLMILMVACIIFIIIDFILYTLLIHKGVKEFQSLTI